MVKTSKIDTSPSQIIFPNRTWRYLSPSLRHWDKKTVAYINSLQKIAMGIGDKSRSLYQGLYVLFDINGPKYYGTYRKVMESRKTFMKALSYFKEHDYYVDDYHFDSFKTGHKHMVIFKLPFENMTENFIDGKYSKLYPDVSQYVDKIKDNKYNDVYKILKKDPQFFHKFNHKLDKDFGVLLKENDGRELDYPPDLTEEIF